MSRIIITITPKPTLLDAQGRTVQSALHSLGFTGVEDVRIGRVITMQASATLADNPGDAEKELRAVAVRMCETLLANPVTETYRIEVEG